MLTYCVVIFKPAQNVIAMIKVIEQGGALQVPSVDSGLCFCFSTIDTVYYMYFGLMISLNYPHGFVISLYTFSMDIHPPAKSNFLRSSSLGR